MELTSTHLRYLLAIFRLSRTRPAVSSVDVAGALQVSRPSVTRMLGILTEKDLVTKERYGKIALTDRGAALARRQMEYVRLLVLRLPALGLDLTEQEAEDAALALAGILPGRCREQMKEASIRPLENA